MAPERTETSLTSLTYTVFSPLDISRKVSSLHVSS